MHYDELRKLRVGRDDVLRLDHPNPRGRAACLRNHGSLEVHQQKVVTGT